MLLVSKVYIFFKNRELNLGRYYLYLYEKGYKKVLPAL